MSNRNIVPGDKRTKALTLSGDMAERGLQLIDEIAKAVSTPLKPGLKKEFFGGSIYSMALSKNGELLLTGGRDGYAVLWDVHKSKVIRRLGGHQGNIFGLTTYNDGKTAITIDGSETYRTWDIESGNMEFSFKHAEQVSDPNFLAVNEKESLLLSGDLVGMIKIWSLPQGELQKEITPEDIFGVDFQGNYCAMAGEFIPNSTTVLIGDMYGKVFIWDWESSSMVKILAEDANADGAVGVSNSGSLGAVPGKEHEIEVWDLKTLKIVKKLKGHTARINTITFSPDENYLISGGIDRTLRLWDVEKGQEIQRFEDHKNTINAAVVSNDVKYYFSAGTDGNLIKWENKDTNKIDDLLDHLTDRYGKEKSEAVEKVLIGQARLKILQKTIELLDDKKLIAETKEEISALQKELSKTRLSVDGAAMKYVRDALDPPFETFQFAALESFQPHKSNIAVVRFSPTGKLVAFGEYNGRIRVLEVETLDTKLDIYGHDQFVSGLSFTPDETRLFSSSWDSKIKCWSIAAGKELFSSDDHISVSGSKGFADDVVTSSNGKIGISTSHGQVFVWDPETFDEINRFSIGGRLASIFGFCFLPNSNNAVFVGNFGIVIMNVLRKTEVNALFEGEVLRSLVISYNGMYAISGNQNGEVLYWNVHSGELLLKKKIPDEKVISTIGISTDGSLGFIGKKNGQILLIDLKTGDDIRLIAAHDGRVTSLDVHRESLVSAGADGCVQVIDISRFL